MPLEALNPKLKPETLNPKLKPDNTPLERQNKLVQLPAHPHADAEAAPVSSTRPYCNTRSYEILT